MNSSERENNVNTEDTKPTTSNEKYAKQHYTLFPQKVSQQD